MKPSKLRIALAEMPSLRHSNDGPFDLKKSEVIAWLVNQPEALQSLFGLAVQSGGIVFDPATKTWRGVQAPDEIQCRSQVGRPSVANWDEVIARATALIREAGRMSFGDFADMNPSIKRTTLHAAINRAVHSGSLAKDGQWYVLPATQSADAPAIPELDE